MLYTCCIWRKNEAHTGRTPKLYQKINHYTYCQKAVLMRTKWLQLKLAMFFLVDNTITCLSMKRQFKFTWKLCSKNAPWMPGKAPSESTPQNMEGCLQSPSTSDDYMKKGSSQILEPCALDNKNEVIICPEICSPMDNEKTIIDYILFFASATRILRAKF